MVVFSIPIIIVLVVLGIIGLVSTSLLVAKISAFFTGLGFMGWLLVVIILYVVAQFTPLKSPINSMVYKILGFMKGLRGKTLTFILMGFLILLSFFYFGQGLSLFDSKIQMFNEMTGYMQKEAECSAGLLWHKSCRSVVDVGSGERWEAHKLLGFHPDASPSGTVLVSYTWYYEYSSEFSQSEALNVASYLLNFQPDLKTANYRTLRWDDLTTDEKEIVKNYFPDLVPPQPLEDVEETPTGASVEEVVVDEGESLLIENIGSVTVTLWERFVGWLSGLFGSVF